MYLEWLGASSEVLGRSLNVPRGVFGDPWMSLGGPREVTGGPRTSLGRSLRVLGGPWGGPREVPGGPWEGLGGSQNRRCFFRASREGPGEPLGWFWCSEVVLGSVLGSPNAPISLIIGMFLASTFFLWFFVDFERGVVLTSNDKKYVF